MTEKKKQIKFDPKVINEATITFENGQVQIEGQDCNMTAPFMEAFKDQITDDNHDPVLQRKVDAHKAAYGQKEKGRNKEKQA